MSPGQPSGKKLPTTPVRPVPNTPQSDDGIYGFDNLAPQMPKKSGSSGNVKEDLHHIQYVARQPPKESPDAVYTFDHLNTDRLQHSVRRQQKTSYDQVPLGAPKSKSPSPVSPDPQDDYIEPLDEEVLKNVKGSNVKGSPYEKLSSVMVDQTYDRLQGNTEQPPQLPQKKKAAMGSSNSPAKPSPPPSLPGGGQRKAGPGLNSPVKHSPSPGLNPPTKPLPTPTEGETSSYRCREPMSPAKVVIVYVCVLSVSVCCMHVCVHAYACCICVCVHVVFVCACVYCLCVHVCVYACM